MQAYSIIRYIRGRHIRRPNGALRVPPPPLQANAASLLYNVQASYDINHHCDIICVSKRQSQEDFFHVSVYAMQLYWEIFHNL
jgi:hypothetical protein